MRWTRRPADEKSITKEQARQKFQEAMLDLLAGKNPGTISFRLKPSKKANETYPLKLTEPQRESLSERRRQRIRCHSFACAISMFRFRTTFLLT
jgi:hypothetical protein